MAYIVQYSPEDSKRYPQCKKKQNVRLSKFLLFVFILTAAIFIRLYGLPEFLIPGDPVVTKNAVASMVTDLKSGEPLNNAVTAFCTAILDNAAHQS